MARHRSGFHCHGIDLASWRLSAPLHFLLLASCQVTNGVNASHLGIKQLGHSRLAPPR